MTKALNKAGKAATAATGKGKGAKVAELATVEVKAAQGRVLAEVLKGSVTTKEGTAEISMEVRRQTLTSESKVAAMKRLLMTAGATKESILAHCAKVYGDKGKNASTLNTVRADLARTLQRAVLATGWRTDGNVGKLATAAVAKLRTHELGVGGYVADVKRAEVVQEKKAEGAK